MSIIRAQQLDKEDILSSFREKFLFPIQPNGEPYLYFCGNSLGLQPKEVSNAINIELNDWGKLGVEGHFEAANPWYNYHEFFKPYSNLFGALPEEYCVMGSLTNNLHLLMVSFYNPTPLRHKILIEKNPFPSDNYAVQTQVLFHGYDVESSIIYINPREGEDILRKEDIIDIINKHGNEIALVMLSGVNFFTGQFFDIQEITHEAHKYGCIVGWDLAHAAGNVELKLHDWNVDFAAWCGYKYLNSGPGSVGSIFVHLKYAHNLDLKRFAGWWSNDPKTRFNMPEKFVPQYGASAWQTSNAPVIPMAIHKVALEIFKDAGMINIYNKSILLTGFLEELLLELDIDKLKIITPSNKADRGSQLSIRLNLPVKTVQDKLRLAGIIVDIRTPDVIRIAPVPLYNSYMDVYKFVQVLKEII